MSNKFTLKKRRENNIKLKIVAGQLSSLISGDRQFLITSHMKPQIFARMIKMNFHDFVKEFEDVMIRNAFY